MTADTTGTRSQSLHSSEQLKHNRYMSQFRVKQCPEFSSGGVMACRHHKPYCCFFWHFKAQKRRKVAIEKDGQFTYSPHVYCLKYSLDAGQCPDGDSCKYLHHNAGDTERKFHPRFYKTSICSYDSVKGSDGKLICRLEKERGHCPYAHGPSDLRTPVIDIKEESDVSDSLSPDRSFPAALDKERNEVNENSKWADRDYILRNYKTQPCKRTSSNSSRSCRQGFACPLYHNAKDRRRSPYASTYRNTPCPSVKLADEWCEPAVCADGDKCGYCHTRVEQQFHPDIYKTTKCHDYQQTGRCPRGVYCAFSHQENTGASIASAQGAMSGMGDGSVGGSSSIDSSSNNKASNNMRVRNSISATELNSGSANTSSFNKDQNNNHHDRAAAGGGPEKLGSNNSSSIVGAAAVIHPGGPGLSGKGRQVASRTLSPLATACNSSPVVGSNLHHVGGGRGYSEALTSNRNQHGGIGEAVKTNYYAGATPEFNSDKVNSSEKLTATGAPNDGSSIVGGDFESSGSLFSSPDAMRVTSTVAVQPKKPTGGNPWFGHALFASSRSTPSPPTIGMSSPIVSACVTSAGGSNSAAPGMETKSRNIPVVAQSTSFEKRDPDSAANRHSATEIGLFGSPLFYDSLLASQPPQLSSVTDLFGEKSLSVDLEDSLDGRSSATGGLTGNVGGVDLLGQELNNNSAGVGVMGMMSDGNPNKENYHPNQHRGGSSLFSNGNAIPQKGLSATGSLSGSMNSTGGNSGSSNSASWNLSSQIPSIANSGEFMGPMGMVNTKASQPVNIPRLSQLNTDPDSKVFRANFYPYNPEDNASMTSNSNYPGARCSFTYGILSSPSSQSPLSHPSSFDGNSASREDLRDGPGSGGTLQLPSNTGCTGTLRYDPGLPLLANIRAGAVSVSSGAGVDGGATLGAAPYSQSGSATNLLSAPSGIKVSNGAAVAGINSSTYATSCFEQQILLPIPEMEMESLTLDQLQEVKDILSCDIRKIDNMICRRQEVLCICCGLRERSVALQPCNCMVVCEACAVELMECPKCRSIVNDFSKLIINTRSV